MSALRSKLPGLLLAVHFAVATVVVPTLHQAFHRNDHDHGGGGIHFHADLDDDDHDDDDDDDGPDPTIEAPHGHRHHELDPKHGEASLFHFGVALSDGTPALTVLTAGPLVSGVALDLLVERSLEDRFRSPSAARAPPAS